jgi:hypothetical protein
VEGEADADLETGRLAHWQGRDGAFANSRGAWRAPPSLAARRALAQEAGRSEAGRSDRRHPRPRRQGPGRVVRRAGRRRDQPRQQGRRRADPGQPGCATATTGSIVRIVRIVRRPGFMGLFVGRSHWRVGVFCRRPSDHARGDSPSETDSCRTVRTVRTVVPPVWSRVLADLRETLGRCATWHWPATHPGHKDRWVWGLTWALRTRRVVESPARFPDETAPIEAAHRAAILAHTMRM